jgi:hypothetical protein
VAQGVGSEFWPQYHKKILVGKYIFVFFAVKENSSSISPLNTRFVLFAYFLLL